MVLLWLLFCILVGIVLSAKGSTAVCNAVSLSPLAALLGPYIPKWYLENVEGHSIRDPAWDC